MLVAVVDWQPADYICSIVISIGCIIVHWLDVLFPVVRLLTSLRALCEQARGLCKQLRMLLIQVRVVYHDLQLIIHRNCWSYLFVGIVFILMPVSSLQPTKVNQFCGI